MRIESFMCRAESVASPPQAAGVAWREINVLDALDRAVELIAKRVDTARARC
ncbi:hypothetical protein LMG23992_05317 [Cupriavidus laharis]|uniref:Uncharacterized protein n=1 Tax=Cupriavidus laharis TaxID=151654 RepID=A0ABM8XWE3_9BURK|nr:hypothetical protein LMG23992_05317 [Cupriavidus laharis]